MCGKGYTPPLLVGVQTHAATFYISMAISQKISKQLPSRPNNTTFVYVPKECSNLPQGHMFTEALFVIVKTWKQPKRPSTEEWIRTVWNIHTMVYYTEKKGHLEICGQMDGTRKHHIE